MIFKTINCAIFLSFSASCAGGFDGERDGTNQFIYSRYLIPSLLNFQGYAIFCDGDMIVTDDIYKLLELRDPDKAVQVVKHDYTTDHPLKYIGTPLQNSNIDYPRKNWSSVTIWNCGHPSNRVLTKKFVSEASGAVLHRFQWLHDDEIGELPVEWNHLVGEYPANPGAKLYHHTLGSPGFEFYRECESSKEWNRLQPRAEPGWIQILLLPGIHIKRDFMLRVECCVVWMPY